MSFQFERRRLGQARIGIITITHEEFDHARRIFGVSAALHGTPYFLAPSEDTGQPHVVVCQASSRSNLPASQTASRLIEAWRPEYIFLAGTAGGVQQKEDAKKSEQLNLGDVIIADYIDYVEYAKLTDNKIIPRKIAYDHPSMHLRMNFVTSVSTEKRWHEHIERARPDQKNIHPSIHVGNVAAGEKIFADYAGEHQIKLLELFDKVIAFEMESYGVASAICEARCSVDYNPQFLTIRGISDFVNAKTSNADRDAWTDYAASAALSFARAITDALQVHFSERDAFSRLEK
ncbi:MAG TPA: hypothetical protein VMD91_09620 [Candidatus Sulfotelmatobacter sp.]|nr:hypothetical protein [Candidatus Sulfotelmatobacter sp.]